MFSAFSCMLFGFFFHFRHPPFLTAYVACSFRQHGAASRKLAFTAKEKSISPYRLLAVHLVIWIAQTDSKMSVCQFLFFSFCFSEDNFESFDDFTTLYFSDFSAFLEFYDDLDIISDFGEFQISCAILFKFWQVQLIRFSEAQLPQLS